MLLLTHITIALASIIQATLGLLMPSRTKLRLTAWLTAATLASGTWLVISLHAPLLQSCESGLMYLGVVSTLAVAARYRLVHDRTEN